MDNNVVESSSISSRQRSCQFPLLTSVIFAALLIAFVTELRKGFSDLGHMAQTLNIPDNFFVPPTDAVPPAQNTQGQQEPPEKNTERRETETKEENKEDGNADTEKEHEPLNIILLYGDDWRHDSIGSAKASIVRTPFLDRLAQQGIKFIHNCVTTSVCWISRATLYSGLYVSRHKSDYPHKPLWYEGWEDAFPKLLHDKGYYTGHVGKWHFNWEKKIWSAFDFHQNYYGLHWYEEFGGKKIHTTKKNERDALDFLKGRPRDKPFMLSVCFFAPHSVDGTDEQYFPQEESMSLYENETVEVPVSATTEAWNKLPYFFGDINEGRRRWGIRFDTPEKHQRMMKNYYRLITEIDQTSEKIFQELESQGVADKTMIIFTTDNGLYHSEHQLAGKWYPHQESIRVPLIIKDPRMPAKKVGTVNEDFTLNIDLASTILGAAKIEQPAVMQGRDMADLYLNKDDPKWRQEFYYEHPVHLDTRVIPASSALVRKRYKYMKWPDYGVEQLFDLEKDPYELEDIINATDLQDMISEMRVRYEELKQAALEPGPVDESGEKLRGKVTKAEDWTKLVKEK